MRLDMRAGRSGVRHGHGFQPCAGRGPDRPVGRVSKRGGQTPPMPALVPDTGSRDLGVHPVFQYPARIGTIVPLPHLVAARPGW